MKYGTEDGQNRLFDDLLPVLMKAVPMDVPGYKKDKRTRPPRRR
jgi:hypothetical protein